MNDRPVVGITLGDPAGIGPEIALKALAEAWVYRACRPLVVGDAAFLKRALGFAGMPQLRVHPIRHASEAVFRHGVVDVLDMGVATPEEVPVGRLSRVGGEAAFRYVEEAIRLALAGDVDATVTNPLNKEALHLAGHPYAGHTEIYAKLTGTEKYTMMLVHEEMRVVHVSTHVSLREACDRVKKDRVLEVIRIADRACREMGVETPRIGVAGLNPHSGENGLFGREEIEEIVPAIREAQSEGIAVEGPVPPDTLFPKARGGWYDIAVAMYHDQGHIPLKLAGFEFERAENRWREVKGVNITLGLPIIRTSVDHGTAFDQAGGGTASPASLLSAITYAIRFAQSRLPEA